MDKEFQIEALMIVATIAMTLMVPFIILLGFLARNRQIAHVKEQQQREHEYQQEILNSQIEVQRSTLQNVADEIHDNIGQLIAIAKMKLNIIEEHPVSTPHMNLIVEVNETVSMISTELRNLAKGLNPEILHTYGVVECVRFESERFRNIPGLQINLIVTGDEMKLGLSREFVLYRTIQECFSNIIKHAEASLITVLFDYSQQSLTLKINDDGVGFDSLANSRVTLATSGSGLNNMAKRIKLIGGEISIESKLGHGTTVSISIPITP